MIEAVVERYTSDSESTLSLVWIDKRFECHGLEDEFRTSKVWGETRIPAGRYRLGLHDSPKFGESYRKRYGPTHVGLIHVLEVPDFHFVLWHTGNKDEDTAACLIVGDQVIGNTRAAEGYLSGSRSAYKRVCLPIVERLARGEKGWVEYIDRDRRPGARRQSGTSRAPNLGSF